MTFKEACYDLWDDMKGVADKQVFLKSIHVLSVLLMILSGVGSVGGTLVLVFGEGIVWRILLTYMTFLITLPLTLILHKMVKNP